MSDKVYVVNTHDDWDSYEIAYFKTRKNALKFIMRRKYQQWLESRYISEHDHFWDYFVTEQPLYE